MRELFLLDGDDADDAGWQERALCAQTDPEAFFPEKGGSTREAKKVCLTCDVRTECLESALMNDEPYPVGCSSPGLRIILSTSAMCCSSRVI